LPRRRRFSLFHVRGEVRLRPSTSQLTAPCFSLALFFSAVSLGDLLFFFFFFVGVFFLGPVRPPPHDALHLYFPFLALIIIFSRLRLSPPPLEFPPPPRSPPPPPPPPRPFPQYSFLRASRANSILPTSSYSVSFLPPPPRPPTSPLRDPQRDSRALRCRAPHPSFPPLDPLLV